MYRRLRKNIAFQSSQQNNSSINFSFSSFFALKQIFPVPPAPLSQSGPNIWKRNRPDEPPRFSRFIFKFQDWTRDGPTRSFSHQALQVSVFPPDGLKETQFAPGRHYRKIVVSVMADEVADAIKHVVFCPYL